ncbi:MAG: RNA methyltransferase [Saprospiraceae bacterium]
MALSKNAIKYVKSLHLKKFRQKYNNFIVEGDKIVRELLTQSTFEIEALFGLPDWLATNKLPPQLSATQINAISLADLERISTLKTPNQVLLIVRQPPLMDASAAISSSLSLYLEDIRDPGNLGTIIRIADWFGIPYVFCSNTSVEWTNPKVLQATMGSFLRIKVLQKDLPDLLALYPSLPVYGAVLEGKSIQEIAKPSSGVVVIGNESRGISAETLPLLTHRITIPKHPAGGAESLNAAVAAGIICAAMTMK